MPNTGMLHNQTFKCERCKHNFGNIWLPTSICCQKAKPQRNQGTYAHQKFSTYYNNNVEQIFMTLKTNRNKVAPFITMGKPTCGFNFSRQTDNRKTKIGIPPSNLVKWRTER